MGKWRAVLETVPPSILDCPCCCTLGGARGVHCHRKLGPPTNAAGPSTRDSEEDVSPVDLRAPPMHLMHSMHRTHRTPPHIPHAPRGSAAQGAVWRGAARRGAAGWRAPLGSTCSLRTRMPLGSPCTPAWNEMAGDGAGDRDGVGGRWREMAGGSHGDSGVQSDGCCRWAWWRAAAAAGVCLGRGGTGGGCLVGQVAPIEVGPSIVVGMHLKGGEWVEGRQSTQRQPHGTARHCTALHGAVRHCSALLSWLRRGAPARARACCSPPSASW